MSKRSTGKVVGVDRRTPGKTTLTVDLSYEGFPHWEASDNVSLVETRSDAALGKDLREALDGIDADEVEPLTEAIINEGYDELADLIKEVVR